MDHQNLKPAAAVQRMERDLGLGPGFLADLILEDDDWSLMIKVHAFVEAALTHLLTVSIGHEELRELFSKMPMGTQTGKVAFARALGLIDGDMAKFLGLLGRLRNAYAHSVKTVGLRIEAVIESFKEQDKSDIWKTLAYNTNARAIRITGKLLDPITFASQHPRLALWLSVTDAVALMFLEKQDRVERRKHADIMREFFEVMTRSVSDTPESSVSGPRSIGEALGISASPTRPDPTSPWSKEIGPPQFSSE
jgi:hypothetical protein